MKNKKTLEEAAENYSENWEEITGLDYENCYSSEVNKLDFIAGAKWQAERMYSEEEVLEIVSNCDGSISQAKKWLEQFKNKQNCLQIK